VQRTGGTPYSLGLDAGRRQLQRVSAAFITPSSSEVQVRRRYAEELDRVRAMPLSALVRRWRPADVDARNQIPALIDRQARLRPVFQSSAAYERTLSALNRRYLASLPAGATVILESWTHDDRHPGLQQSGAWKLLLQDFDVVEQLAPFVVLRKAGRRALACDVSRMPGRLDEYIDLPRPPDGAVVIAAPALAQNAWGRFRTFAFRDAPVMVDTRTGPSAEEHQYLFPVEMGAQGFLLQPELLRESDLASVWDGTAARSATQVRLRTAGRGYVSEFEWQFEVCRPITSLTTLNREPGGSNGSAVRLRSGRH
jgi:hypothetical protein